MLQLSATTSHSIMGTQGYPRNRSRVSFRRARLCCVLACVTVLSSGAVAQGSTTTHLRDAAQFLAAGNLERADAELQLVLHTSPREYRALDLLGVVRVLQHREADAEALFQGSIQSRPGFGSAHAHLGLLYAQTGRDGDAIPELQRAIKLDPSRTDASGALLHIFRQHATDADTGGNLKQALGLLIEARKLAPEDPDVQFEFASAALKLSLLQDAIDGFRKTLAQRKDDPLAVYGLGRAYGERGRLEEARRQFERYVALRKDDPSGYCSLGITLAALDQPGAAKTQFQKSIALAPEQTEAYFRLGSLELRFDDLDSARIHLQHVLDHDPTHAGALSALGRLDFAEKQYAAAAELLLHAINSDDSRLEAHYYLALTYKRLGQKSESDREFERVSQLQQLDIEKRRSLLNKLNLPPVNPTSK